MLIVSSVYCCRVRGGAQNVRVRVAPARVHRRARARRASHQRYVSLSLSLTQIPLYHTLTCGKLHCGKTKVGSNIYATRHSARTQPGIKIDPQTLVDIKYNMNICTAPEDTHAALIVRYHKKQLRSAVIHPLYLPLTITTDSE